MMNMVVAERLKYKRSFAKKLALIAPLSHRTHILDLRGSASHDK